MTATRLKNELVKLKDLDELHLRYYQYTGKDFE